jgi:hypothetical protein
MSRQRRIIGDALTSSRRGLVLAGLVVALATTPSSVADASDATVGTATEAWYRSTPTCPAVACAPAGDAPSEHPAGTVHVAVTAGQEAARTYLAFDLTSVPDAAVIDHVTVRLPVASAEAGSSSPEAAELQVCMVNEAVQRASGSVAEPPETTCGISASALYDVDSNTFVADLARFVDAWNAGDTDVAIVPALAAMTPTSTWHVAFGEQPITATIAYDLPGTPTASVAAPAAPPPSIRPSALDVEVTPALVPSPVSSGEIIASLAPSSAAVHPVVRASSTAFRNPVVFYLPLALLLAVALLGRVFTRPITGARA